jgi:hypothetical protein
MTIEREVLAMVIKFVVITTDSNEEDLFFNLVSRGRWADIPYYYSVENHDWLRGTVQFEMLCCSPAPRFKVGIAGKELFLTEKEHREVLSWLAGWGIKAEIKKGVDFDSPEAARAFLEELRKDAELVKNRRAAGVRVRRRIKTFYEETEKELRARNS